MVAVTCGKQLWRASCFCKPCVWRSTDQKRTHFECMCVCVHAYSCDVRVCVLYHFIMTEYRLYHTYSYRYSGTDHTPCVHAHIHVHTHAFWLYDCICDIPPNHIINTVSLMLKMSSHKTTISSDYRKLGFQHLIDIWNYGSDVGARSNNSYVSSLAWCRWRLGN